jgi:polyisoprenoid-binding protein YceI
MILSNYSPKTIRLEGKSKMTWNIDPQHSEIGFSVRHMMISKVRGQFRTFEGTFDVNPDNPAASSISGKIDVTTIDTNEEQRDAHLRSADFFDVENHPTMNFKSTRIERQSRGQYKVYGDLTIKGITREVSFDVTDEGRSQDPWGNQRWGVSATAQINRKDFGLTWNVALETGGWLVSDEITITAEVQLVLESETESVLA